MIGPFSRFHCNDASVIQIRNRAVEAYGVIAQK